MSTATLAHAEARRRDFGWRSAGATITAVIAERQVRFAGPVIEDSVTAASNVALKRGSWVYVERGAIFARHQKAGKITVIASANVVRAWRIRLP